MNIDGLWNFTFTEDEVFPESFDEIAGVPGCFDAGNERFGKYGVGWYSREVCCGGRMRLTLRGGIKLKVFWDGKLLAASKLAFSPWEIDFDAGAAGRHTLTVAADNRVDNAPGDMFYNYYDYYAFGGIYDHVDLSPQPCGVDWIEVLPLDHRTGRIRVRVKFCGEVPAVLAVSFDGGAAIELPVQPEFELNVPDFKVWSVDEPNLHTININGVESTFGIRTVECRGEDILLNGEKIFLTGYNRHESHPQFGYATPDHLIVEDLRKIKLQGCNFIRGCHYPQKQVMLDACDRLGLLVWEEAMAWQNNEEQCMDTGFCDGQEAACRAMVHTSINHPSIIIYGFLNECTSQFEQAAKLVARLAAVIREIDPTRAVSFASCRGLNDLCFDLVDIISLNLYPGWYGEPGPDGIGAIEPCLTDYAEKLPGGKPVIISEIGVAAIPGDHSGWRWSEDFQAEYLLTVLRCIRRTPRFSGVAFWHFCDARTCIYTRTHLSRPRGFNNKGVMTEYRIPKLAWRLLSDELKKA